MALTKVSRGLLSTSIVDNGNATAITIDSSENVGIGTTSPSAPLTVNGGSDNLVGMFESSDTLSYISFKDNTTTSDTSVALGASGDNFTVYTGSSYGTERLRIDASGNLLVGKTYTATGNAGQEFRAGGYTAFTRSGGNPLELNRLTSDGTIANFSKDGSTVGSIRSISGDSIGIGNGDAGLRFVSSTNRIQPVDMDNGLNSDALTSLGDTNKRFKDIYRSGSTISTSDRNMKQDIRDLTDAEQRVAVAAKGLLKAFRFIDTVAAEGDSANIHFGIIAQDLAAAFEAEGLDANDYQVYKSDTFTDDDGNEQTRLGICYENLLAFIIAAI